MSTKNNKDKDNATHPEQGSRCYLCNGGGELVLCDGCPLAFHSICLLKDQLPSENHQVLWHCPLCYEKIINDETKIKKASPGYLMLIASKQVQAGKSTKDEALQWVDSKKREHRRNAGLLTPEEESASEVDQPTKEQSGVVGRRFTRRDTNKQHEIKEEAEDAKHSRTTIGRGRSSSGWGGHAHISVGQAFQIHGLNELFLESSSNDCYYDSYQKRLINDHPAKLTRPRLKLAEGKRRIPLKNLCKSLKAPDIRSAHRQCQLVWSPHIMRSLIQTKQHSPGYIRNQQGIDYFIEQCQRDWPKRLLYPFQEEFALQLLYDCRFHSELAYQVLQSPDFDFNRRCHPATAPYLNKWHPRHQRGTFLSLPFQWKLGNSVLSSEESNSKKS